MSEKIHEKHAENGGHISQLIKAWKVGFMGSHYITRDLGDAVVELEESDVGDEIAIERIRISEVDLTALPEFEGF